MEASLLFRTWVFLLLLIIPFGILSAGIVSQEIIPTSSPVYEDMDRLYLTTGIGTPSNARPWTKTEADLILSRIDPIRLDASEAQLYEAIRQEINHLPTVSGEDDFSFDVGFRL